MRAGILAAGSGDRLKAGGIDTPKPLVRVAGRTLVDHLLGELAAAGARDASAITNEAFGAVADHLRGGTRLPVRLRVKTTASSLESFQEIAPDLGDAPVLHSTVDAIHRPGALAAFARAGAAAVAAGAAGALALTDFVDDEKPLRVLVDGGGRITRLGSGVPASRWITAGFYYFHPRVLAHFAEARARRLPSLRWFLELLVERGEVLAGVPVARTVDVDRPSDVVEAERLLAGAGGPDAPPLTGYLAVLREELFSPGKVGPDAEILYAVGARLAAAGYQVTTVRGETLDPAAPAPAGVQVLAMCQGERALATLRRWQTAGTRVFNTAEAIRNCYRDRMIPVLAAAGAPLPESRMAPTHELAAAAGAMGFAGGLWVKRGDVHATHAEDVSRADGPEGLPALAARLTARGVASVALQRHAPGRTVKFYAVLDDPFFRCYPADAESAALRDAAHACARALGVEVFGGDAQVAPDGSVRIIDLNDWPTFSRCREDAAEAITARVLRG
ncbi:MAG: NDP-sugar synthase [Planctomycetes bacterium]|nr:NDP-sugar synthase [Planctomycetota bacterium]